jgi:hypothetical protein
MIKKLSQKHPLIVEAHPDDYEGYEFITLIRYNDVNYLTIVDNTDKKFINCYVLDFCKTVDLKEDVIIDIAERWYEDSRDAYPVSIEFSKLGITEDMSKILRSFTMDFVTRVIGPLPFFSMKGTIKVRKRKRKPVPEGVKIVQKKLKQITES